MLVSFLFWNLKRNPLQARLARIVQTEQADIVLLAECDDAASFAAALSVGTGDTYRVAKTFGSPPKVVVITRFASGVIEPQFDGENGRVTMRRILLPGALPFLLAAVHFPSKVNYDDDDQTLFASELALDIRRAEADANINRTVLVGDFNMNPYEVGLVGATAFHAMMTRTNAARKPRTVSGRKYSFFYNPMWGYFGDRTDGPPGTFYLSSSKPVNAFWQMYDQVLLRPTLMNSMRVLRILDTDGIQSLLTQSGIPDAVNGSDHLPLLFRLEL